jgi:hypothetical protein
MYVRVFIAEGGERARYGTDTMSIENPNWIVLTFISFIPQVLLVRRIAYHDWRQRIIKWCVSKDAMTAVREGQQCPTPELATSLFQSKISALDGGATADFPFGLMTSLNVGFDTVAATQL